MPLTCPVCGDRNKCALDDIGKHIHEFSLLSLPQYMVVPPLDELDLSRKSQHPTDSERYTDEDETAVPLIGREIVPSSSALKPFANEQAESVSATIQVPSKPVPHVVPRQSNEPLFLRNEDWDLYSVSGVAAIQMLAQSLQSLSDIAGDVANPLLEYKSYETGDQDSEISELLKSSRRFFLKAAPPFSITDYLLRIHKFAPHSPGVYLAAASYIHQLCIVTRIVPATRRTVHRLALAAIRIASKTLEDNQCTQERISRLGGISMDELEKLEISFCSLLRFELFLRPEDLQHSMLMLQSRAREGLSTRQHLTKSSGMRLLPMLLPEASLDTMPLEKAKAALGSESDDLSPSELDLLRYQELSMLLRQP